MIYNSAMIRGSGGVTYHVENDQYNTFWPTEARPGQYVVNPSGAYSGVPSVFDETGTYMLTTGSSVRNIDDLPPKVREVLESAPSTLAAPEMQNGYIFFIMPEENVKIISTN